MVARDPVPVRNHIKLASRRWRGGHLRCETERHREDGEEGVTHHGQLAHTSRRLHITKGECREDAGDDHAGFDCELLLITEFAHFSLIEMTLRRGLRRQYCRVIKRAENGAILRRRP